MLTIVSPDNSRFKALKKLCQSGRERRKQGRIVFDGMHLVDAYERRGFQCSELVLSESGLQKQEIRQFLQQRDRAAEGETLIWALSDALFASLSELESPSGILGLASWPTPGEGPRFDVDAVLLDGVQDPGNLGSILRSAAAAGFSHALLSSDCAQPWSPKTLRAGQGAQFVLDIYENQDLAEFVRRFQEQGGAVLATRLDSSCSLFQLTLPSPLAWLFGSEGQGVRPELAQQASIGVRIPMPGQVESLNVGAAAAICFFETLRQREQLAVLQQAPGAL